MDFTFNIFLQLFISNYPTSDSIPRVNELILVLNKKLEKKNFEIVKLYYQTGKFSSAICAIDDFLAGFPETSFLEEISFVQLKAYYELGKNSIDKKRQQRIKEAIFASNNFLITFPNGNYVEEAKGIYKKLKDIENN